MATYLDWVDIKDKDARQAAKERYEVEAKEVKQDNAAHVERLWLKQAIIRVYAANND